MMTSWTDWERKFAVALFVGGLCFVEIAPRGIQEALAADPVGGQNNVGGPPREFGEGPQRPGRRGLPQAMPNAMPFQGGAGQEGDNQNNRVKPGGGAAGNQGVVGEDPWSNVNMPDELAVGIEYKKPRKGVKFSFNLVDVDLIQLVKIIGNITGKAFILGGKTPKIIATIYAPNKIDADEAYQAFLSVLQVNGLTVVPAGRYLKILPLGGSTTQNMPILEKGKVPPGDEIVTRLHPMQHVSAADLAELLGRFKSPEGDITVYSPTNTLIITDYGSSINRIVKLINLLDTPGTGEQIWIEPVNHADATELAEKVLDILDVEGDSQGSRAPKSSKRSRRSSAAGAVPAVPAPAVVGEESEDTKISKILADERTNSLIIVASESSYLRILELVKRLDVAVAGEGTLHVHKLQHADAVELAKTLSTLSKGLGAGRNSKKGQEGMQSIFEGNVEISPDKATNSLVIVSSLRDYLSLKQVIEKLDQMLRQVFVEAVIMEVSLDKNKDLGLGLHVGKAVEKGGKTSLIYGASQPNSKISSLSLLPGMMSGLAAGIRGPDLEGTEDILGTGLSIPAFGVALQALQTNSDVNVLSTPNLLATDNVEASITVGENVPVQQGYNPMGSILNQIGNANTQDRNQPMGNMIGGLMGGYGGMGGFSIGRQNVGLTLKVTPQINDDDQVRLEISLEIKEVSSISDLGPNISQKSATTTSIVGDQQTIVIGGLITDNEVITTEKVPFLGDIPILGVFFRHKTTLNKKRNLLIFLTPYIIRKSEDFKEIFNRKMAERREFIERWTAFEYHRIDPHLDWARTNGVISDINQVITAAERDAELKKTSDADRITNHTPKEPIAFPKKESKRSESSDDESAGDTVIEPSESNNMTDAMENPL